MRYVNALINNFSQINIKDIAISILFLLFCVSIGKGYSNLADGFSLGFLLRASIPSLGILFLMIFFLTIDFDFLRSTLFEIKDFRLLHLLMIVVFGVAIAPVVIFLVPYGMLIVLISLFCFVGLFAMVFAAFRYKFVYGLYFFLLLFPVVSYVETYILYKGGLYVSSHSIFFSPSVIFFLLLFAIWFFKNLVTEKRKIILPLGIPIAGLLITFLLSSVFSMDVFLSMRNYLLEFVLPVMMFVIVANCVDNEKEFKYLLFFFISFGIITVFLQLYFLWAEYSLNPLAITLDTSEQGSYFFWSPRGLSVASIILIPLTLSIVLSQALRTFSSQLFLISLFLILILRNLAAYGRTNLIAVVTSLLVFLKNKYILLAAIFILICAFIFPSFILNTLLVRFHSLGSLSDIISPQFLDVQRYDAWISSVAMIRDHPILGIGLGMWPEIYPKYGFPVVYYSFSLGNYYLSWVKDPHNHFLHLAVSGGIFALLFWVLLLWRIYKENLNLLKNSNPFYKSLGCGLIGSFIAVILHYPYGNPQVFFLQSNFMFWVFAGFGCVFSELVKNNKITEKL